MSDEKKRCKNGVQPAGWITFIVWILVILTVLFGLGLMLHAKRSAPDSTSNNNQSSLVPRSASLFLRGGAVSEPIPTDKREIKFDSVGLTGPDLGMDVFLLNEVGAIVEKIGHGASDYRIEGITKWMYADYIVFKTPQGSGDSKITVKLGRKW